MSHKRKVQEEAGFTKSGASHQIVEVDYIAFVGVSGYFCEPATLDRLPWPKMEKLSIAAFVPANECEMHGPVSGLCHGRHGDGGFANS